MVKRPDETEENLSKIKFDKEMEDLWCLSFLLNSTYTRKIRLLVRKNKKDEYETSNQK